MWMPTDMERPNEDVELMALDWESLGRLVRERTQQVLAWHAATTEGREETHASPESANSGRLGDLP